jgi:hypothetical protein
MKKVKTVIEVTRFAHGDPLYVIRPNCMCEHPTTKDAAEATDYTGNDVQLQKDLSMLILETDESYPKSGLRVDTIAVVKVAILTAVVEVERREGRPPKELKAP